MEIAHALFGCTFPPLGGHMVGVSAEMERDAHSLAGVLPKLDILLEATRTYLPVFAAQMRQALADSRTSTPEDVAAVKILFESCVQAAASFRVLVSMGHMVDLPASYLDTLAHYGREFADLAEDLELFGGEITSEDVYQASQSTLVRHWDSPEEDAAWADL